MHGDDIGLEVVPEAVKVMKAAAAKTGHSIEWTELLIGKAGHEKYGNTLPKITEETLRTLDGCFMGPIGHNAYPRGDMTWAEHNFLHAIWADPYLADAWFGYGVVQTDRQLS